MPDVPIFLDGAAVAGRPVVRPVRPLVSFALFAGSGGMVVAADTLALSPETISWMPPEL